MVFRNRLLWCISLVLLVFSPGLAAQTPATAPAKVPASQAPQQVAPSAPAASNANQTTTNPAGAQSPAALPPAAVAASATVQNTTPAVAGRASTLQGTVTDPDNELIPGATITFTSSAGQSSAVKSGSDGTYTIPLAPGTYSLIFAMPGFANLQKQAVKVGPNQIVTLNAQMVVGDQTTVITVTSDAAVVSVDADANASATIIKGKDLDALSDDPDELQAELQALAGPAAGPSGGQIYVDGFTGGQLPPKSSIREIRINQNPFSAQYDKVGFGRIEVFTKPGTDKLRGYFSFQGNDKALNTSNPFLGAGNQQPGYYSFFSVGSLSGPISKAASYNVGYQYRNQQLNAIIDPGGFFANSATSTTPCNPGDTTCTAVAYPASARAINQPSLRFEITPRVDLAFGTKNVLTARYQYERNSSSNQGIGQNSLPSNGYSNFSNENELQLIDTQTFSDRTINETNFEFLRDIASQTPYSSAPQVVVQGNFTSGGNGSQLINTTSNHFEVQNYTSLSRGAHFILFGGRLRTTGENSTSNSGSNGTFTYNYLVDPCTDPSVTNKPSGCVNTTTTCSAANVGVSSYQCNVPSQFRITQIAEPTVTARETDLGVYAEDQWKVKPNFSFNYGLRFEAQNEINSTHDFAPRVSLAYGIPRGGGKAPVTVLRAGYGIFYDRFGLGDFLTVAQLQPGVQQQQTVLSPVGATCNPTNTSGCNAAAAGGSTVYSLNPNIRASYTLQTAVGVDQQLGKLGTISANWLDSRGDHHYYTTVNPLIDEYQYQFQSEGVYRESQLIVTTNIRTSKFTLFGFYSLDFADANTSGSGFIRTSANSAVDYGRATFANTNSAAFGGTYNAPFKISFSPFTILRSGTPYNLTTGIDENGDSVYNDRPAFLPGVTPNCRNASSFAAPAAGASYQEIPVNYCTGPASITFNLRVSRSFGFGPVVEAKAAGAASSSGGSGSHSHGGGGFAGGPGSGSHSSGDSGTSSNRRYNLTMSAQAQNLFNNVNYAPPISTLTSTQFGQFTQLYGRPYGTSNAVRVISLQATLTF